MQFIIKAYDGEGMLGKRMEVRPRHLEGVKKLGKQVICGGGLLDDEGRMKGSAMVVEFPDRAAGLFERSEEAAMERYNHLLKLKEMYAEA